MWGSICRGAVLVTEERQRALDLSLVSIKEQPSRLIKFYFIFPTQIGMRARIMPSFSVSISNEIQ